MTDPMIPQNSPFKIHEESWEKIRQPIEQYIRAVLAAWQRFELHDRYSYKHLVVQTESETEDAVRLPQTGALIRGVPGVAVRRDGPRVPSFKDLIYQASGSPFRALAGFPPNAVDRAEEVITQVVMEDESLRFTSLDVYFGRTSAEHTIEEPPETLHAIGINAAIKEVMASYLGEKGYPPQHFREITPSDEEVDEIIDLLRVAVETASYSYEIVSVLNTPPVDSVEPIIVWQGQYYDRECKLELSYPTDEVFSSVLRALGYSFIPHQSGLDHANALLRFSYSLPRNISNTEADNVHLYVEELAKQAVDLLRVLRDDDIGVLHTVNRSTSKVAPRVRWMFEQHPHGSYHIGLRKAFSEPSSTPLSEEAIRQLETLFSAYSINRPEIRGLTVAMDRLRGIYERYQPGEHRRLVDLTTGLEALFLNDGDSGELQFRLQVRAAKFLAEGIQDRRKIYYELKQLYRHRSKIAHGADLKERELAAVPRIEKEGLSILRTTIHKFLTTGFGSGKTSKQMGQLWLNLVLSDKVPSPSEYAGDMRGDAE